MKRYYTEELEDIIMRTWSTNTSASMTLAWLGLPQQKPVKPVIDAKLLKKFGQTSTCSKVIIAQTKTCSTNVQETSQTLHERCQC